MPIEDADDEAHDQRPAIEQVLPAGREVDRHPRQIDDDARRGRRGDERRTGQVHAQQRGAPYSTLVADEAAEEARQRAGERGHPAADDEPTSEAGQLRDAGEDEQQTEQHAEQRPGQIAVQQSAGETASGAGDAEDDQHATVNVAPQQP